MRYYETGSLIISNYTHHLYIKKIIIHHIIYIKKIIHINFKVHLQDVNCQGIAIISNIDTTMGWYYILCVLCERNVKLQVGSFWCAKCKTKINLFIPKLEALTLTTYSLNIYNIFISL